MKNDMINMLDWRRQVPELSRISDAATAILDQSACALCYATGARLFGPGAPADGLIVPVFGTVRVQGCAGGRETTLYRAQAGDGCTLTMACRLSFETRGVEAVAETDVETIFVPRVAFDQLMAASKEFRATIFDICARRITDLYAVIEETTAGPLRNRLAAALAELRAPVLAKQARESLSVALGTSEDVVAQYLAEFERRSWITMNRGWIEFRNLAAIKNLASA